LSEPWLHTSIQAPDGTMLSRDTHSLNGATEKHLAAILGGGHWSNRLKSSQSKTLAGDAMTALPNRPGSKGNHRIVSTIYHHCQLYFGKICDSSFAVLINLERVRLAHSFPIRAP
jgi:hypothetical protein